MNAAASIPENPEASTKPRVSIVIPFYNEEENVENVLDEVLRCQPEAEVIAINDGSSDRTGKILENYPRSIRTLTFPRNLGQSAGFYHGLHAAQGEFLVMMDGDGQNDPADIAAIVSRLDQADLVCGRRAKRRDTPVRRLTSKIANSIRQAVLGKDVQDTGCSLKAFHRRHLGVLVPFNALHRFIPAFFVSAGLRIAEVDVNHRPRQHGVSKYTLADRAWRGLRDVIGVRWLLNSRIPGTGQIPPQHLK